MMVKDNFCQYLDIKICKIEKLCLTGYCLFKNLYDYMKKKQIY